MPMAPFLAERNGVWWREEREQRGRPHRHFYPPEPSNIIFVALDSESRLPWNLLLFVCGWTRRDPTNDTKRVQLFAQISILIFARYLRVTRT